MVGVWDVDWGGMPVHLALRPDGSARFEYTKITGAWDGSWKFNKAARRVTLTLLIGRTSHDDVLDFTIIERDAAKGIIEGKTNPSRHLEMVRLAGNDLPTACRSRSLYLVRRSQCGRIVKRTGQRVATMFVHFNDAGSIGDAPGRYGSATVRHDHITTEHLLLALLQLHDSVAARVLRKAADRPGAGSA